MAAILPTKGNLIITKRSRELAQTGFELMDKKRNILVREIMSLIGSAEELQSRIDKVFSEAYLALQTANITLGKCDQIALNIAPDDTLNVKYRSVMGVEIPEISGGREPDAFEYGFTGTNEALDDAYLKFHTAKKLATQLAQIENAIYRLATAIKKAQKRTNALQNIVIPDFDDKIKIITDSLEEKEREEFVRLKVIKAQNKKRNAET